MSTTADRCVAFVRAVMVGREGLHRDVLIEIFERAGGTDVRSHLATGNVSFHAPPERIGALVDAAERDLAAVVGRPTEVFVRTHQELQQLVASDPFAEPPYERPRDLAVLFLRADVPPSLAVPVDFGDCQTVFAKSRRELFIATRDRPDGRHPGSPMGLLEKRLGQRLTARAWSTVLRVSK